MDPMMGGGDQDVFEPAHFVDQFGMYKDSPDLRGGIHEYDIQRPEPNKGKRDKIYEPVQGLKDG